MKTKFSNLVGKIKQQKHITKVYLVLLMLGIVSIAVFYTWQNLTAAPTTKPNILIIDDTTGGGGTSSSATAIQTYLTNTGLFTITKLTTATWPTAQDAALNYDAVIYSAGNRTTPLTTTERDWLNSYLNTYYGHLIMEGESILNSHYTDAVIRTNLLKVNTYSNSRTSNTNIRMTNVVHPVTYGMVTTSYSYTMSTTGWRGHSSLGTGLGRWSSRTSPYNVLSAWQGINRRERLVFMDFDWDNWSSQTQREKLMNNAVKWVSEFCEVQVTSMAPESAPKGTKDLKMAKLKFSTYATAPNNNTNTINKLTVYNDGSAANSSIKLVRLYEADSLGNITKINPVGQTTMGADGKAVMSGMNLPITAGTDRYYVLTYDLTDPADEAKTIQVRLGTGTDFGTREKGVVKVAGSGTSGLTTISNTTRPDIPLYVQGINQNTGDTIRLQWQAVTSWDLAGYHIYRAVDTGSGVGAYSRITTTPITDNFFVDSGLTEFFRYYYKVRSIDSGGNESLDSDSVRVIPNRPPGQPTNLVAANSGAGGRINLTWNAAGTPEPADPFEGDSPDLAGYYLYAATDAAGPYEKITPHPLTETTYTHSGLTDGIEYFYKLAAVDRYENISPLTDYTSGIPSDTTAPEIVTLYPAPAQDYVEPTTVIQVKVDDVLDVSGDISQWLKLEQKNLDNTYTTISGTVSYDINTHELLFTPDAALTTVGNFRVTLKGGQDGCVNVSGLNILEDEQWTFGTLLNPHADFKTNNTLCGYCHSAHSASGAKILREPGVLDLCFSCHDGSGSSYDVKGGRYFNGKDNVPMAAGGYDLSMGSTSTHFTDLSNPVFGSPGLTMQINCITCHEPHGSANYRNIRTNINGAPVAVSAKVAGPAYAKKTVSGYEVTSYTAGWEEFCATCHSEYMNYHSVTTITGEENWRHRTGVPLTGGSTDGRWVVGFPTPGLYSTLPTIGTPTGAHITNAFLLDGGGLSANTYNYIITAINEEGESVRGNIVQVVNPSSGRRIKLTWARIQNAYQYKIYRYIGTGEPDTLDVTQFKLLAEVPDYPIEYFDDGSAPEQEDSPPLTSTAKIGCITCHMPHGTPSVADNGEPTRLRRYDNDGVCQDCHKK